MTRSPGSTTPPPTISGALQTAATRLSAIDTARPDAEELLSRMLALERADLYRDRDRPLTPEQWNRFDGWLSRRASGEPVQYITGRAAFRDIDLAVTPAVLIPRPETEGLVEAVLQVLRTEVAHWPRPRVLDLGTGSGAIALAIAAEHPHARVVATDASEAALALAEGNARALGLEERVRFARSDWFDAVGDDRFEVVVSNPPYIATGEWDDLPHDVRAFEPHAALFSGTSGLEAIREIVDEAPRHLVTHGLLALELSESRAEEVASWLEGAHDWSEVRLLDDLGGYPRVLLARREAGPAIAPAQWGEE